MLTIGACYDLSRQHYPLIRQQELILKTKEYSLQNAAKGYLPQLIINGQATYQSAVTEIPIHLPNAEIPVISKDQYKLYGEVSQVLYDNGLIRQQKQLLDINAMTETQKAETELYQLKGRVNQLFFGILILDAQLHQNELLQRDIQNGLDKMNAVIANGAALRSSADVLKAQLLQAGQRTVELKATRKAYTNMLTLFTGQETDSLTVFETPESLSVTPIIHRPELTLYEYQKENINIQKGILSAKALPRLSAFFQGGYGRPALNFLSNEFEPYYIGGLRLNWTLNSYYTIRKEKQLLDLNKSTIDVQKEVFLFNTNLSLQQQQADIDKGKELMSTDSAIIELRNKIKTTAYAQMTNGTVTGNDYLREVNAEDAAIQNLLLHQMQWLLAQYNYQTISGN